MGEKILFCRYKNRELFEPECWECFENNKSGCKDWLNCIKNNWELRDEDE